MFSFKTTFYWKYNDENAFLISFPVVFTIENCIENLGQRKKIPLGKSTRFLLVVERQREVSTLGCRAQKKGPQFQPIIDKAPNLDIGESYAFWGWVGLWQLSEIIPHFDSFKTTLL